MMDRTPREKLRCPNRNSAFHLEPRLAAYHPERVTMKFRVPLDLLLLPPCGFDFTPDGKAAVMATWNGDVWRVEP